MAYATGPLTDANSSQALYNVLAGLLTTAGYTLVDTVVISTRTHKVWLSAAANNSMNLDWYLDVAYTTTGVGPVHLTPFEFFDPATDLGYRGPYRATDQTIEPTYGSRYGAVGYALETNWDGANAGPGILTSNTSFSYWFSVTPNRVIALSSLTPTLLRYAGFYDPHPVYAALAGAKLFPLIKVTFDTSGLANVNVSGTALTRVAPATVLPTYWAYQAGATPEINLTGSSPLAPNVSPVGESAFATRFRVAGALSYAQRSAAFFGYLNDVYAVPVASTVVRGDTLTIGGVSYVSTSYGGSNDSPSAVFKAA